MNIRLATIDDADSLIAFNQAMALETEGKRLDPKVVDPAVRSVFTDAEKGFYVVAEDEGQIIGD